MQAGIAFIPQELAYFPALSVAENVVVGAWPSHRGLISRRNVLAAARDAAQHVGIEIDVERQMSSLRMGERQLVEIVKALMRDARIVVLDEPTAALNAAESRRLFQVLGGLAAQGQAILYISHRMDEVFEFSDRIDILRNGRLIASRSTRRTTHSEVIEDMLGQAAGELAISPPPPPSNEPPALSVRGWSLKGDPGFQNVSFDVARGEVVGLFGLRGSGAELVAEGIAGLHRDIEGTVAVGNREYPATRLRSPRAARRLTIGYVPAERKRDGLVLTLSVQASLGLLNLPRYLAVGGDTASVGATRGTALADRVRHPPGLVETEHGCPVGRQSAEGHGGEPTGDQAHALCPPGTDTRC